MNNRSSRVIDKVGVDHALLYYKTSTVNEWQMLGKCGSLAERGDSNVIDVLFDDGIEFAQGGRHLCDDEHVRLRLRWDHPQYRDVWIHDFERKGFTISQKRKVAGGENESKYRNLAVKFTPAVAPTISIYGARGEQAERGEKRIKGEDGRTESGQETEEGEVVEESSSELALQRPNDLPIYPLAIHFDEDGYSEFLLVFPRRVAITKPLWNLNAPPLGPATVLPPLALATQAFLDDDIAASVSAPLASSSAEESLSQLRETIANLLADQDTASQELRRLAGVREKARADLQDSEAAVARKEAEMVEREADVLQLQQQLEENTWPLNQD